MTATNGLSIVSSSHARGGSQPRRAASLAVAGDADVDGPGPMMQEARLGDERLGDERLEVG